MSWNQTSLCTDHCSPGHKISTKSTRLAPPPSSPFSAVLPGFGVSSSLTPLPGPTLSASLAFGYIIHPDIDCPAPPATLVSLVLSEKTGAVSTIKTVTAQQTSRADGVHLMAYTMPTNEHSSSPPSRIPSHPKARLTLASSQSLPRPLQFTALSPVSSWSPQSARTGKRAGVLSSVTRASSPSLPRPQVRSLHNSEARLDHRFVTVGPGKAGTRTLTPISH